MNQPTNERQRAADAFAQSLAAFQELLAEVAPEEAPLADEPLDEPPAQSPRSSD